MSAKKSATKAVDLDKLYKETKAEIVPKLEYLRSIDDYCTSEAYKAIDFLGDIVWSITTGKSREKISNRVVDFLLVHGLANLFVKILKSLTTNDDRSAFESRDETHSIVNNLISPRAPKTTIKRVTLELLKSGIAYPLLQDLEHCDPNTVDPRQRVRILRDISQLNHLRHHKTVNVIPIYRASKAVDILMKFTQSDFEFIKVNSLMLLAAIVNEKESVRLVTSGDSIATIIEMLQKTIASDENERGNKTCQFVIEIEDTGESKSVNVGLAEFVEGLNDLSCNDANKGAIVQHGGVHALISILTTSDRLHPLQAAVEALWKMSFTDSIREVIMTHLTLDAAALEALKTTWKNARLNDACIGLLQQLEIINIHDEPPVEHAPGEHQSHGPPPSYEDSTRGMNVMISYNWDHQQRALMIRDKLKSTGYINVWMDVDKMRGNILKAMADGVEKADAIVMCFSRKYKGSASCQSEGNYAYKLHKPIIPVKLEEDYDADGWLGIVTGMDMYIKGYSDAELEANLPQLLKELEGVKGKV